LTACDVEKDETSASDIQVREKMRGRTYLVVVELRKRKKKETRRQKQFEDELTKTKGLTPWLNPE